MWAIDASDSLPLSERRRSISFVMQRSYSLLQSSLAAFFFSEELLPLIDVRVLPNAELL